MHFPPGNLVAIMQKPRKYSPSLAACLLPFKQSPDPFPMLPKTQEKVRHYTVATCRPQTVTV